MRVCYRLADSARDRAILGLAYQCGITPIDISKLTIEDLPKNDKTGEVEEWKYFTKARSKTREIWFSVITPELSHDLNDVLFTMGDKKNDKKQRLFYKN